MREGSLDAPVRHLPERARLKLDIALFVLVTAALVTRIVHGIRLALLNPERIVSASQRFPLLAVPFFVLAGYVKRSRFRARVKAM